MEKIICLRGLSIVNHLIQSLILKGLKRRHYLCRFRSHRKHRMANFRARVVLSVTWTLQSISQKENKCNKRSKTIKDIARSPQQKLMIPIKMTKLISLWCNKNSMKIKGTFQLIKPFRESPYKINLEINNYSKCIILMFRTNSRICKREIIRILWCGKWWWCRICKICRMLLKYNKRSQLSTIWSKVIELVTWLRWVCPRTFKIMMAFKPKSLQEPLENR